MDTHTLILRAVTVALAAGVAIVSVPAGLVLGGLLAWQLHKPATA